MVRDEPFFDVDNDVHGEDIIGGEILHSGRGPGLILEDKGNRNDGGDDAVGASGKE